MRNIRIFLLRVIIGTWMIPISWITLFPLLCLLGGVKEAIQDTIYFDSCVWNGMP